MIFFSFRTVVYSAVPEDVGSLVMTLPTRPGLHSKRRRRAGRRKTRKMTKGQDWKRQGCSSQASWQLIPASSSCGLCSLSSTLEELPALVTCACSVLFCSVLFYAVHCYALQFTAVCTQQTCTLLGHCSVQMHVVLGGSKMSFSWSRLHTAGTIQCTQYTKDKGQITQRIPCARHGICHS